MKGEFGFIGGIREMFPSPDGVLGIGDNCTVIPQNQGYDTLVSTDILVEGSHFLLDDISSYQLGWKSAVSFPLLSLMTCPKGGPMASSKATGIYPRAMAFPFSEATPPRAKNCASALPCSDACRAGNALRGAAQGLATWS